MSRLFLKIFFSFWIAAVLIIGASAWINLWVMENYGPPELPAEVQQRLAAVVDRTAALIAQRGITRLPMGPGRHMLHIIDADGRDLNPRPLPPHLEHLGGPGGPPDRDSGPDYRAVTVTAPNGESYRVIGVARLPPRLLASGRRGTLARLAVAVVVSAVICWLLAAYLTRPIRRLRWAAAGLAQGDLSRRVGAGGDFAADEIGDLGRDFDRMADRLQRARTAQHQLLRDVSHELRSPLARMQVALELAREKSGDVAAGEHARIEAEAEQLNRLVGDVLLLSRGLAEDVPLQRERTDLAELIRSIVADANYEGRPAGKRVEFSGPEELICEIDPQLVRHAVENVIRNALHHSPADGLTEVTLAREDNNAVIRVSDCGPGVPEDELDRIFLPFHRVDRARSPGGQGIGLAITTAAVEGHGGRIGARNRDSGGLVVEIQLPATIESGSD